MKTDIKNRNRIKERNINYPPKLFGDLPFIGHAINFRKDPAQFFLSAFKSMGDFFYFKLFNKKVFTLTGPDAVETFFSQEDDVLNPRKIYRLMVPIFGKNIAYDAEPEIMSEQLGFLRTAITPQKLKTYSEKIAKETYEFFRDKPDSYDTNIFDIFHQLTTYSSTRTLLGDDFRERMTDEFSHLFQDMERALTPLAYFAPNIPIPRHIKRNKARIRMVELITEIINDRKKTNYVGEDFLQSLIGAKYRNGKELTNDEITGIMLTVIFAGHHTSATLSSWLGIEFALNQDYTNLIEKELKNIYKNSDEVSSDTIKDMKYLHYALQEGERVHPPIILLMRDILKPIKYKGFDMTSGDLIAVSPYASHRDVNYFKNPEKFDPLRFSPERNEARGHRYALIGFGGGKHRCLGFHFAYMQIKTIWTVILNEFMVEPLQTEYPYNPTAMIAWPSKPDRVRFIRRKKPLASIKY